MPHADWSAPEAAAAVRQAAEAALAYLTTLPDRRVAATATHAELIGRVPSSLPTEGLDPEQVVAELLDATEGGIVATGSPRYHGFVIGGALPATVAADWLTSAWDQNAGLYAGGPAASVLEQVAATWVLEALHLPSTASVAMVTGCQMAHVTCLAAARHRVLADRGWDVERDGLVGAPPIRVLTGALHHVTLPRAMRLLGLGQAALETVALDEHHRMRPDALAEALAGDDRPTIVCAQLG
ncbi:MAG: pyridoxal phosphate-dependent decarboxylase family protein, partial [Acidimicrobiales bacterium]